MANRSLYTLGGAAETGYTHLDGYVQLASGTTGVVSTTLPSSYVTVARTGTGQYTFTFLDSWPALRSVQVNLVTGTPLALQEQIISFDVTTAQTVLVNLINTSATPTDPTNGCGLSVSFVLRNSSL